MRWIGKRGLVWSGVLPEVNRFTQLDRSPGVLLVYMGGTDLGRRPFRKLICDIKFMWALFPGIITIWSDIVQR